MRLLLILLSIIPLIIQGQNFPLNEEGKIEYSEVIEIPNISKQELYHRGRQWMAETFVSSESVIDYESEEIGKIIGKGAITIQSTGMGAGGTIHPKQAGYVRFYIQLEFKDGRYKYKVYNLRHDAEYTGGDLRNEEPIRKMVLTSKTWKSIRLKADQGIRSLINSLLEYTKMEKVQDDDW